MAAAALQFTREHLRAPLTLAMLLVLPATFVWLAGDVLDQFAKALGGGELGAGATALGAGWGAAFVCGALGYFQMSSSRDADRRLALAGFGSGHVATSRLLASLAALMLQTDVAHPWHAAAAIGAFAAVYLALGALVATVIRDQLSGSLVVAFVFLLDTFSGEGMGNAGGLPTPSRFAGSLLLSAGVGEPSPGGDWLGAVLTITAAAVVAWAAFGWSARERGL
jgi:hypothetical protein